MQNQQQPIEKELTPIQQKRKELILLSKELREDKTEDEKLNDLIIDRYKEENPDIEEFNTFKGWMKEGYQVKKGEKAFLVWGRPKKDQQEEQSQPSPEDGEDKEKFWPVAFIFSNLQVRPLSQKEAA
jgi:hypothetical protein